MLNINCSMSEKQEDAMEKEPLTPSVTPSENFGKIAAGRLRKRYL